MPVIKRRDHDELTSEGLSLERVQSRSELIIEQARHDAVRIIECATREAAAEAETLREEARRQGYEEGYREGSAAGALEGAARAESERRVELDHLQEAWTGLLADWERQETDRRRSTVSQALELSLQLAERIVHRRVAVDPSVVVEQLRRALDLVQSPQDLEIVVADDDRARVHQALPGLLERFEEAGYVSIIGCGTMKPGGCRLQMRGGEIDASLETQLARLAEAIVPERPEAKAACDEEAA